MSCWIERPPWTDRRRASAKPGNWHDARVDRSADVVLIELDLGERSEEGPHGARAQARVCNAITTCEVLEWTGADFTGFRHLISREFAT